MRIQTDTFDHPGGVEADLTLLLGADVRACAITRNEKRRLARRGGQ